MRLAGNEASMILGADPSDRVAMDHIRADAVRRSEGRCTSPGLVRFRPEGDVPYDLVEAFSRPGDPSSSLGVYRLARMVAEETEAAR